jgi:hypothetical protein
LACGVSGDSLRFFTSIASLNSQTFKRFERLERFELFIYAIWYCFIDPKVRFK